MRFCLLALLLLCPLSTAVAQESSTTGEIIPLWENGAPGFENRKDEPEKAESYWVKNIHNPTLTAFLPEKDKATGAAVIIYPGGGHRELVFKAEGVEAAQYFNKLGVAAFVLKYRLGREEGSPYKIDEHAKQDGQRAVQLVRSRASEWNLDPTRIGVMGFSAGGEVVSLVSYSADAAKSDASDAIDQASSRPDFQIYIYPGPLGVPEILPENTPPTFMLVSNDDMGASRTIFNLMPKLREAGTPLEVHIFSQGGHGFNMGNRSKLKSVSTWPDRLNDWLADNFILNPTGREEYASKLAEQKEQRKRWLERQNSQRQKDQ